jgi:hypothetical protein
MNYYNRMVDEIVRTQELLESQTVIRFFEDEFQKYDGVAYDIYKLESIVQTQYVDIATPTGYAGDPFKYVSNAIQFAIKAAIHKLTDAAKLDNLSFVLSGNPMATQLISEWTTWRVEQGSSVGGIKVNNSYGFATNMGAPVRVVASNQLPAYTPTNVTQTGAKELVIRIVAFPTDPEHISFRHLKYTSHLLATPNQAAYMSKTAPNGAMNIVTATSRYTNISIQGLQVKLVLLNSARVYGPKA